MTDLAALVVRMQADNSEYIKALDQSARRLERFTREQNSQLKEMAAKFAEAFAIEKIVEFGVKAIESIAWMERFSQQTGISTESLSGFKLAASAAGMNIEEMGMTFKKLNVAISDAAEGSGKSAIAFKGLGIEVTDGNGKLRDAGAIMDDLADKFQKMADGPNKVALAIALMGRQGQEMIPILNLGSEGLREMRESAEKAGLVISGQLAAAAEDFSRKANIMKESLIGGLSVQLASQLLPVLRELMDMLERNGAAGELLKDVAAILVGAFKAVAVVVIEAVSEFQRMSASITAVAHAAKAAAHGEFSEAVQIWKDSTKENEAIAEASSRRISEILDAGTERDLNIMSKAEAGRRRLLEPGFNLKEGEAQAAALKKLEAFRDGLKEQALAFGLGEAAAVRYKLQIGALADDLKKAGDEGKKVAAEALKFADQLEVEKATQSVKEYTDKLREQVETFTLGHVAAEEYRLAHGKLGRELDSLKDHGAAAKKEILELSQAELAQKNQSAITQLDDQTLRLTGHLNQAALAAFDLAHQQLKTDLSAPNDNAAQAEANRLALDKLEIQRREVDLQSQLAEQQQHASVLNTDLAASESKITLARAQGRITDIEASNQSEAARSRTIDQLKIILAQEQAIADKTQEPGALDAVKRFGIAIEQLQVQMTQFEQSVRSGLEGAFAHNFADLITGAKNFKQAILGFLQDIDRQFADMIAKDYAQKLFGAASGSSSGGALGGLPGLIANLFGASGGGGGAASAIGAFSQNGGAGGGIGNIVGELAVGGTIPAGGIAVVGERGPELAHTGSLGAEPMTQPDVKFVGLNGPELIYAGPKDLQIVPNAVSKAAIAQHIQQQQPTAAVAQLAAANDMAYSLPQGAEKPAPAPVSDSLIREKAAKYKAPKELDASALVSRNTSPIIAGGFAQGGTIPAGRAGIVGEKGPELAYSKVNQYEPPKEIKSPAQPPSIAAATKELSPKSEPIPHEKELAYAAPQAIAPTLPTISVIATLPPPIIAPEKAAAANDMSYSAPMASEQKPAQLVSVSAGTEKAAAYQPPAQIQPTSVSSVSAMASRTIPPIAGAFETGGTIPAGKVGIVGEDGPELAYSGSRDMQIVPTKSANEDRAINVTNHFTIHSANGTISRTSQMQIAAAAARSLSNASARNNG